MHKERKITKYANQKREVYHAKKILKEVNVQTQVNNYYSESMNALVQYIKKHDINPSEKSWNKYAIHKRYLSSKTIGYLSGIGFNTLCRKLRKEVNKEKKKEG